MDVPDAILAGIPDEEVARICFEKGVGATVTVSLGGKMDKEHGDPVELTAQVEHLYSGDPGNEASIATLRAGGVRILVTDTRKTFRLLDDFRKAGLDPLKHKLVVVKQGYLMPELRDAAPREIMALTPGCTDMDLGRSPFRYITRPSFPLDRGIEWRPTATNVGGYID